MPIIRRPISLIVSISLFSGRERSHAPIAKASCRCRRTGAWHPEASVSDCCRTQARILARTGASVRLRSSGQRLSNQQEPWRGAMEFAPSATAEG